MSLPFGLKVPSKNTLIFSGIAGAISGIIYTSNKHAEESRSRLAQRVAYLADRPCGTLEMPRKVTVYISAPPGDSLEKSRNWFREYVKPILVAGAVDYEVKEAKSPGQIETSVIEEVVKCRREAATLIEQNEKNRSAQLTQTNQISNPFSSPNMSDLMNKQSVTENVSDGILAIGRNAYREVLSGLSKGCDASLAVIEEVPATTEVSDKQNVNVEAKADAGDVIATNNEETPVTNIDLKESDTPSTGMVMEPAQEEQVDHFSLPPKFTPVIYVPHVNIIGWTNIPYRLYMWYADDKRIDQVGKYVVAAVLNQTRPMEERDADKGQDEKKYWLGDENVDLLLKNDVPIVIDERIIDKLTTYTSDDLP